MAINEYFLIFCILLMFFCGISQKDFINNNINSNDDIKINFEDFENLDYYLSKREPDDTSNDQLNTEDMVKIWDHWGEWSPCSVSCGIGKMTRWRHCVSGGCATGEKEAQIKTCTYSAC